MTNVDTNHRRNAWSSGISSTFARYAHALDQCNAKVAAGLRQTGDKKAAPLCLEMHATPQIRWQRRGGALTCPTWWC